MRIKITNKITKGVYELGSIFKTFTVALALEHKLVKTNTVIKNIPKKIRCSIYDIKDMKEHQKICQLKKFWLDPLTLVLWF